MNDLEFVVGVALIAIVSSSAFIVLKSRVCASHGQQVVTTSARRRSDSKNKVIVAAREATLVPRVPMQLMVAP